MKNNIKNKVSVIMSIYKEPTVWIAKTIDSVINQTFRNYEFIIACDSPDYSEAVDLLKDYAKKDDRIVLVVNKENIGLTKTLNRLLTFASGEYIARIDADDVALPCRLCQQVTYLDSNPTVDVCHTNISFIDENDNVVIESVKSDSSCVKEWLVWENVIAHPSVMFRRELLNIRTPFYNENYRSAQDYELWTFLDLHDVKFGYINDVLLHYRVSSTQISKANRPKQLANFCHIRTVYIKKLLKKNGCVLQDGMTAYELLQIMNHTDSIKVKLSPIEYIHILYLLLYNSISYRPLVLFQYFTSLKIMLQYFSRKECLYLLIRFWGVNRWPVYYFGN